MNTRRQFVIAGGAGALLPAAAGAACVAADAAAPAAERRVGGMPAQQVFERLKGASFAAASGAVLRLERVRPRASRQRLEQFTLVLSAPAAHPSAAGLQELHHPETGRFALHLAASGRPGAAPLYRADISLMV